MVPCEMVATCEMVAGWEAKVLPDGDVVQGREIACGKRAVMADDGGTCMCFMHARGSYREGGILTAAEGRRYRRIEAEVLSRPN